jgi:hypothetical protein
MRRAKTPVSSTPSARLLCSRHYISRGWILYVYSLDVICPLSHIGRHLLTSYSGWSYFDEEGLADVSGPLRCRPQSGKSFFSQSLFTTWDDRLTFPLLDRFRMDLLALPRSEQGRRTRALRNCLQMYGGHGARLEHHYHSQYYCHFFTIVFFYTPGRLFELLISKHSVTVLEACFD